MDFDDDFRFEKDGPVHRIVLNRPEKHDVLTVRMRKQLHEALRAARFDEEGAALVITRAGHTFCAGDDIVEFPVLATRKLAYDSAVALAEPASGRQAEQWNLAKRVLQRVDLDAEVQTLTGFLPAKSRYAIRPQHVCAAQCRRSAPQPGPAFELGVDPGAEPATSTASGLRPETASRELRERSATMWADQ